MSLSTATDGYDNELTSHEAEPPEILRRRRDCDARKWREKRDDDDLTNFFTALCSPLCVGLFLAGERGDLERLSPLKYNGLTNESMPLTYNRGLPFRHTCHACKTAIFEIALLVDHDQTAENIRDDRCLFKSRWIKFGPVTSLSFPSPLQSSEELTVILFAKPKSEGGETEKINPKRPILAVAPLNSMPYIGPPMPNSYTASSPAKDNANVERVGPAIIFLSSFTTREEWDNIMATNKLGVALTGSAAMGKIGSIIGLMDIGECEHSYLFRVSLPGVSRDESEFSCDVEPDGKVLIKGVTTTGEQIVCKNSQIFHMLTRNLCPPGHFSISFQLPGPVDQQQFSGSFGTDGILEGIVKKR
ncbi:hypothetical protein TIFTF001_013008 [Ficus carica]|uniref:SHSP domain-containing protein n=1 Tax=Ficus carica TaxID=3494 RepID=A0AA88D5L8_FICCA|nr:hypothetical protein TIFTF001_013008 [Ficus carica]